MSVTCALYTWSTLHTTVFVAQFSGKPGKAELDHLVGILPELRAYRAKHARVLGIFDLQGHPPADTLQVILRVRELTGFTSILEGVVVVNADRTALIASMVSQINLITKYRVHVVKAGTVKQQKQQLLTVAKYDREAALLTQEYLAKAKKFKRLKTLEVG